MTTDKIQELKDYQIVEKYNFCKEIQCQMIHFLKQYCFLIKVNSLII